MISPNVSIQALNVQEESIKKANEEEGKIRKNRGEPHQSRTQMGGRRVKVSQKAKKVK